MNVSQAQPLWKSWSLIEFVQIQMSHVAQMWVIFTTANRHTKHQYSWIKKEHAFAMKINRNNSMIDTLQK